MKKIIFSIMLLALLPTVFAEADTCSGCQEACHSMSGSCPGMGDATIEVVRGACAFQCRVVHSSEGRCPSASEVWNQMCGIKGGDTSPPEDVTKDYGNDLCTGVECPDHCEEKTSYYGGECEPSSGECLYYSQDCEFACSQETGKCEQNTQAPRMILELTPDTVILSKEQEIDIMVQLIDSNEQAVEGADVYVRVSDPEFSGILGDWGFMDVNKYTDSGGIASATLGLPGMKSIDRMHYEEFPIGLRVEVTAAKHTGGEDWSATKTELIEVRSPVPEISKMWIDPDPAQAYSKHTLNIEIDDEDEGPANYKYTIRCFGGSLGPHLGEASNSDSEGRVFYSGEKTESIEWTGPSQGIDADEAVEFKESLSNMEGLAKNLGANRFGIVGGVYKAANGINGNAQNLAKNFDSLTKSESWEEGAYRTLDLGLEGFKTFVGVYTLAFKSAPGLLGKISNDAGDFVDYSIGKMQAKLKGLAHGARAEAAETRVTTYACAAIVEDNEGFVDWYFYEFDLEYEGFESDKRYGTDDEEVG